MAWATDWNNKIMIIIIVSGPKVSDNNGQATHGARKHAWRMQAAWANYKYK